MSASIVNFSRLVKVVAKRSTWVVGMFHIGKAKIIHNPGIVNLFRHCDSLGGRFAYLSSFIS